MILEATKVFFYVIIIQPKYAFDFYSLFFFLVIVVMVEVVYKIINLVVAVN